MALGTLTIEMAANVARLQTDMKRAADAVENATSQMRKAAGLAAGALAAIGVGLSVSAFTGFIRGAIDAADAMAKISQKTGMAVKDIAGLQLAYQQSGLGADMFEKTMARMSRTMAEGNKAFAAMGVSVRDTSGQLRPMKDVLGDVADKFASYADGAEKTALAQEIFGKAGADMIPLLNSGSEALQEMDEWAQKLGLTFDEGTAKQAEQFNDTLDLLNMGLQGVGRQIAAQMLPTLTTLAGEMLSTATDTGTLSTAANALGVMLKGTYTIAASGIQIFANLGRVVGGAGAAIAAILRGDFAGAKGIMEQVKLDNSAAWTAQMDSIKRLWAGVGNEGVAAMATVTAAANRAAPEMAKPGKAAKKAMREAKDEAMELFQRLTMKDVGLDPKYYSDLNKLHGLYQSGRISVEQYRKAVETLTNQQAFAKEILKQKEEAEKAAIAAIDQHRSALMETAKQEAQRINGLADENKRLREEVELIGLSARQITQRTIQLNNATIAEKENQLARLQNGHTTTREMAQLEEEIRLLRERNELLGQRQHAQELEQSHQRYIEMWQSIDRTAHDVFVNIWEDGAGTFKRLGKTLKAALLDMLYQLTVRRWIINIGASFSGNPSGFLQAFGMGGGQGGGLMGNAGSMMRGASLIGNWLGFGSGAAPGTLALANAWGAMGGNSMSAFIAANGGWGTMGGGAMASGAGGLGGLAAGMAAVAAPLIIGAIVESNSRDRHGGAAYATSDWRNDPYARVVPGSLEWNVNSSDLPDHAAMIAELQRLGIGDQTLYDKFNGNSRALYMFMRSVRGDFAVPGGSSETDMGRPDYSRQADMYLRPGMYAEDFYRGQGFISPEELGWWNNKGADIRAIDPAVVKASRAIAESVVSPLTDLARMVGDEADFRATVGFANRGKGALWGAMQIERDGAELFGMDRADYKNSQEFMRAVYGGAMEAMQSLDLPEWARGQVEGARAQLDALDGEQVGTEAAALYQQTAAAVAQTFAVIQQMIEHVPLFADATQDIVHSVAEASGGLDALSQRLGAYHELFFNDAERQAMALEMVRAQFAELDIAMPGTRAAFRELVESIDQTTVEGQKLLAELLGLSEAFAQLTPQLFQAGGDLAEAIAQGLLGTFDGDSLGAYMAQTVEDGIYNAVAGHFAGQITQIIVSGVIDPVIQAAITGSSISAAASSAAIADMVASANAVASAAAAILSDPEFQSAISSIGAAIGSINIPAARATRSVGSYTSAVRSSGSTAERAAREVRNAWASIADSLIAEVQRIRGELADAGQDSLSYWQTQFALSTAAARAGDEEAAKRLTKLSGSLLKAAESEIDNLLGLQQMRAWVAQSLEDTAGYAQSFAASPPPTTQRAVTHTVAPVPRQAPVVVAADPALVVEVRELRRSHDELGRQVIELTRENVRLQRRWDATGMPPVRKEVEA